MMEVGCEVYVEQGVDVGILVMIIVLMFNECDSVVELVVCMVVVFVGWDVEIFFVDDSVDDMVVEIVRVVVDVLFLVWVIYCMQNMGGLGGVVVVGFQVVFFDVCIVMDGDLQYFLEFFFILFVWYVDGGVDVVVVFCYIGGGDISGLGMVVCFGVFWVVMWLMWVMFFCCFVCSIDFMMGFFFVDCICLDLLVFKFQGFKIFFEIFVCNDLCIVEVLMEFVEWWYGMFKVSLCQGGMFIVYFVWLCFGKMLFFVFIGVIGVVVNFGIMWGLIVVGVFYVWVVIVGVEVMIIGNFLLQEWFVFVDMKMDVCGVGICFVSLFVFNNVEVVLCIFVMVLMVEIWYIFSVFVMVFFFIVVFFVWFLFYLFVVYVFICWCKGDQVLFEFLIDMVVQWVICVIDVEVMKLGEF